ncbi:MAG TPA: hypothetical protein VHL08_04840 [Dongiaceae bacterium]|jgi:hypothetical protein|nr:hypothetical protein [Dongiaceae bacterium]
MAVNKKLKSVRRVADRSLEEADRLARRSLRKARRSAREMRRSIKTQVTKEALPWLRDVFGRKNRWGADTLADLGQGLRKAAQKIPEEYLIAIVRALIRLDRGKYMEAVGALTLPFIDAHPEYRLYTWPLRHYVRKQEKKARRKLGSVKRKRARK